MDRIDAWCADGFGWRSMKLPFEEVLGDHKTSSNGGISLGTMSGACAWVKTWQFMQKEQLNRKRNDAPLAEGVVKEACFQTGWQCTHREKNLGLKSMHWVEWRLGMRWGVCVSVGGSGILAWMSLTCSGCLGMVWSTLLLWLSCAIAQVTAKGSERGEEWKSERWGSFKFYVRAVSGWRRRRDDVIGGGEREKRG